MCLPFCSRPRQEQQQRHRLYACICEFCFGFSFAAQRCQLLLLLLLPAQQDLCAASHQHTLTRTLSHSLMCTHRGIHRLPTHSLTACFSSLSPLHCVAVAAAAAAAAALASSSTLRCPHSHNNNENECTTTCNNMHVHEPRQRRSAASLLLLCRCCGQSQSLAPIGDYALSLLIWVVFFVFCKRVSCRYSASHCRTVSLVQFSREASKTCFLLKPTTPTNPNPDRAKPDQDNTDLGVEPQFGFATRFKCFLSLPSAVPSTKYASCVSKWVARDFWEIRQTKNQ